MVILPINIAILGYFGPFPLSDKPCNGCACSTKLCLFLSCSSLTFRSKAYQISSPFVSKSIGRFLSHSVSMGSCHLLRIRICYIAQFLRLVAVLGGVRLLAARKHLNSAPASQELLMKSVYTSHIQLVSQYILAFTSLAAASKELTRMKRSDSGLQSHAEHRATAKVWLLRMLVWEPALPVHWTR